MKAEVLKQRLERLESVLLQHGETDLALMIRPALEGSEQDLRAFLVSNELWGGAGSIADQAEASQGRGDARREIEGALIRLGLEQIRQDVVNSRTDMWVDTFCRWRQAGI